MQVSLFVVDELHLFGGERGPVLEVIVSRMHYIGSQTENQIRILALSTSLANVKDLGEWIGASSHGLLNFPPSVRPVPLEIHIQGVDMANYEARMQAMTKPTYTEIVQQVKKQEPALIFVPALPSSQSPILHHQFAVTFLMSPVCSRQQIVPRVRSH
ncbi:hypothetical protein M758_UG176600 [Ceratodon purpureus]|nr:hypothetical protein M758_UG176600 [Ceratodon purpureus]